MKFTLRSISTLALLALTGLAKPASAQFDLLVAGEDSTNFGGAIYRYNSSGAFVGIFNSGGPALDGPSSMTFGPDGNVYALSGSNTIYRYNGTTGAYIDTFVPTNTGGLNEAKYITFGPDGNLYVASNGSSNGVGEGGEVLRFNGTTGAFMNSFVANGAGGTSTSVLSEAMSLAFGKDGNLYVGNDARSLDPNGNNHYNILRFNATTGAFVDTFVPDNDHGLLDPNALVFGPDGNLYIAHEVAFGNDGEILRYDPTTGAFIDTFVTNNSGGLDEPYGFRFGPDGFLYVTSADSAEVKRYNATTGAFVDTFVTANSGGIGDPKALLFLPAASVPEPGSIALLVGMGAVSGFALRRRNRK